MEVWLLFCIFMVCSPLSICLFGQLVVFFPAFTRWGTNEELVCAVVVGDFFGFSVEEQFGVEPLRQGTEAEGLAEGTGNVEGGAAFFLAFACEQEVALVVAGAFWEVGQLGGEIFGLFFFNDGECAAV